MSEQSNESYGSDDKSYIEESEVEMDHAVDDVETPEIEVEKRYTSPILTKFERAKILGVRAQQISMAAPIMVEYGDETDPVEIAKKELREKKTPLIILRRLPDNTYEKWRVKDLINFYD